MTGERAATDKETLKGKVPEAEGGFREGWQMEDDENRGTWERQKEGGEKKWRGKETQTQKGRETDGKTEGKLS